MTAIGSTDPLDRGIPASSTHGLAQSGKITDTRDLGTEVEVSDGVKPGDQVVLTPPVNLEDGSKVQVRATPTAKTAP
jgi:hypothetical protein